MRRFLFIFSVNDNPSTVEISESNIDDDFYACQIKPVLKGLDLGEYWRQYITDHWFVIVRIK